MSGSRCANWLGEFLVVIDLEYRDALPSFQNGKDGRSLEKQQIRRALSPQLQRKWRDSPQLSHYTTSALEEAVKGQWHYEANVGPFYHVNVCGFDAIPLVTWHNRLACALEITVVGETRSAADVIGRGDLDNGLKVLFDALRLPKGPQEVPGNMFGSGNEPLFCLLEDDSLIHKFSVEAIQSPFSPAECSVRIRATVTPSDGTHQSLISFR